jgi:putative ABC transport system permease protein
MPSFIGHVINQQKNENIIATRFSYWEDAGMQVNSNPFNVKDLIFTDSTFYKVFPLEFIAGNPEEALVHSSSLVFTESQAKKLFGSIDIIGKTVRLENQFDFTVTGVIKDQPFLHFKFNVLASIISLEKIAYKGILQEYDGWSYPTYLLLPDEMHTKMYEIKIVNLLKKFGYNSPFHLKPFDKIYYSSEVENETNTKHGNLLYNKILIAISILILLLASINFINLTIAHAVSRSKEVGIKKIQGASIFQLTVQFLFEIIFIVIVSLGLALSLIIILTPFLNSLTGFPFHLATLFSIKNLLIFLTGTIGFVLITGIYPSLYISSYTLLSNKNKLLGFSDHKSIRNGLIIFQNLISIVLICCTMATYQQFRYMNKKDLGFKRDNIVNLKINSRLMDHLDVFKEELLKYPEIISASYSNRTPGSYWGSWCCIKISGIEDKEFKFFDNYVDPDYLKTMGIKLKEGENLSLQNESENNLSYLINETAIKQYNIKEPIGRILTGNGRIGKIVGVVNDFHYRGLNYAQTPVLLLYETRYIRYINIKIDKSNTDNAIKRIRGTWQKIWPEFAFEYNFLDETYDLQYKSEKQFGKLLFSFAMLALFIASIGLFGLSLHSSERRTKEIGIRKVNGARTFDVMAMLNQDFVRWVTISFIIACPIAYYAMNKWLQNFAYKTELSWWVFGVAGAFAVVVAVLTVSCQSWRVATRNPVEALRHE